MLHRLYQLLIWIALPGVLLRLLWRARKNPGYAQRIGERFGYYKQAYRTGGTVIHAVSVGETLAAEPLIRALLSQDPQHPLTVTTTTPTGSARVKQLFGDSVQHVYLPYDYPSALKRFFKAFKPARLIIMETEWWPNLFLETQQQDIPLSIVNGRLSERSLKGYAKLGSLSRMMAKCIHRLGAQTQSDADHFIALGVPADRVVVTGNLKFDLSIDERLHEQAAAFKASLRGRPVWIAASTHAGEEALVIETIQAVKAACPQVLCVVVPRHPERFIPFYQALVKAGLTVARRSEQEPITDATQVYYGDTMGELRLLYGMAQVAFVAGSFVPAGGHNMLEAIAMGCAVVMGPHLQNVSSQSAELVKAGGMVVVDSPETLANKLIELIKSDEKQNVMNRSAQAFMGANQGSLNRTLSLLLVQ